MRTALIALGGKFTAPSGLRKQLDVISENLHYDEIIGVDSGCHLLKAIELEPTHILGDFDSIGNLSEFKQIWQNALIHTFNSEKDETDAELAFMLTSDLEIDKIVILGAFGGRVDHMLSVFFMASQYTDVTLIDECNFVKSFNAPFSYDVSHQDHSYISLVPLTELRGVTLSGFKYSLVQAVIPFASTLGISNELIEDYGKITIESGRGYLIFSKDS